MDVESDSKNVTLLSGARQVAQISDNGALRLSGDAAQQPVLLTAAADEEGFSLAWDTDTGRLLAVGRDSVLAARFPSPAERVCASGCAVLPGLVDAHCHPVWAGCRLEEFADKLRGASYMELQARGGGILGTARATAAASRAQLARSCAARLNRALRCGTTTSEAKSGYGLDWPAEEKLLGALRDAAAATPVQMSITYLGAHAVAPGDDAEAATRRVEAALPLLAAARAADALTVHQADVFIEQGVFSAAQARRMLEGAAAQGLRVNAHADELRWSAGAELCGELHADAASHLEQISAAGVAALAAGGVVAVLLPTTAHYLHLPAPPVAALRAAGVPLALGSDFNPNAPVLSLPLVMHLACLDFGLSCEEALVAATLNAAAALGLAHQLGSLEVGKAADLLVVGAPDWRHLLYQPGAEERLLRRVFKAGRCVYSRPAETDEEPVC